MLKLLIVELFFILLYLVARYWYYNRKFGNRHKFKKKLYDFFNLRDRLIWLVASNQIKENDDLFQLIYKRINYSLHYFEKVNKIDLKTIEKIIAKLKEKDILEIEGMIEKIEEHESEELKAIIKEYDEKLVMIVLTNSILDILLRYILPAVGRSIPTRIKNSKLALKFKDIKNSIDYIGKEGAAIA